MMMLGASLYVCVYVWVGVLYMYACMDAQPGTYSRAFMLNMLNGLTAAVS